MNIRRLYVIEMPSSIENLITIFTLLNVYTVVLVM
jgi:hypothetical protein